MAVSIDCLFANERLSHNRIVEESWRFDNFVVSVSVAEVELYVGKVVTSLSNHK